MALNIVFAVSAALCFWMYWRHQSRSAASGRGVALALITAAVIGFGPLHFAWRLGQFDLLLLAILAAPLALKSRTTQQVTAGVALGLATILKVSPAALFPAMFVVLGWRFALTFGFTVLLYIAATISTGQFGNELYLFREVLPKMQFSFRFPENSAYRLLFSSWAEPGASHYQSRLTTSFTAFLLVVYLVLCAWLWRRKAGLGSCLAVAVGFSHVASPFLEPQHYTLSLLAIVPLAIVSLAERDSVTLGLAASAYVIGLIFIAVLEASQTAWPAYSLLISDLLLISAAISRNLAFKTEAHTAGGHVLRPQAAPSSASQA